MNRLLFAAMTGLSATQDALKTAALSTRTELGAGARFLRHARAVNMRGQRELIRVGAHSIVAGELLVFAHGGRIEIGDWCYVGESSRIWSASSVTVGSRVLISHNVNIHDSDSHSLDPRERHVHFRQIAQAGHPSSLESVGMAPVRIGDDVWIGFNAVILKGVTIGSRSVIGAGSVVTADVAPDSLFLGTSVRRKLNDDDS